MGNKIMPIYIEESKESNYIEPKIDIEKLKENEYCLASYINFGNLIIEEPSKEKKSLEIPSFRYDEKEIIKDRLSVTPHLIIRARRIRNYLTFIFKFRVPLNYKMCGKDLLLPHSFPSDDFIMIFSIFLIKMNQEEVNAIFKNLYDATKTLLNKTQTDSVDDIIINLFGSSLWTEDMLDNFIYKWRIIELIANQEISFLKNNDLGRFGDYIEPNFISFLKRRLPMLDKIKFAIKKYSLNKINDKYEDKLKICKELRDNISHGNITSITYKKVLENIEFIKTLSNKLLELKFEEFKLHL